MSSTHSSAACGQAIIPSVKTIKEAQMARKVLILVGTKKGAFIFEGDETRRSWKLNGPHCQTWPINHLIGDPETGTIYGAGGAEWFGPAVWRSADLGET